MSNNSTYTFKCINCDTNFGTPDRRQKFCSRSCSATFHNTNRKRTEETKNKISKTLTREKCYINVCNSCNQLIRGKQNICDICKEKSREIEGPYSTLHNCKCKVCNVKFMARTSLQYCDKHRSYTTNKRMFYAFRFNVYDYPDLFDLKQLEEIGWYAPRGKSGKWNPDGMSRDHKISISEAIKNGYDRYYITHPLNCELMKHSDNNKKKSKSSISYEQLKQSIDDFDLKNGGQS